MHTDAHDAYFSTPSQDNVCIYTYNHVIARLRVWCMQSLSRTKYFPSLLEEEKCRQSEISYVNSVGLLDSFKSSEYQLAVFAIMIIESLEYIFAERTGPLGPGVSAVESLFPEVLQNL
jgi:hypothetical protein